MLNLQSLLHQLSRKITIFMISCVAVLISLPTTSVLADGYYSAKDHRLERVAPYYTIQDRRISRIEAEKPYYTTKERQQSKAARYNEEYIKTGKRTNEIIPEELQTRSRERVR
jgi:hypothetical protein